VTVTASKLIWLALGGIWIILRWNPERRARKTPIRSSSRDSWEICLLTISLTGLGIIPVVYIAIHFPRFADYAFFPVQGYFGIVTYVAALWLFYRTHRDLKRNWSLSLELREHHMLVTTGSYAYVRHPMYASFWLMAFAQLLMLPNFIVGLAGLLGFGSLFFGRVRREEEMMIGAFGDEYRAYMRRTSRLVPWIY